MGRSLTSLVAGLGVGCGSALAQTPPAATPELKTNGNLTTYLNADGNLGGFAELKMSSGSELRLHALIEKPSLAGSVSEASNLGLDLALSGFSINLGAGVRESEMEFSRIAFAYKSDEGHRARISLMQTPTQDQILFDGRVKLSEQLAAQAAVDDSGNFRARLLLEGSGCGLSLGGGRTGEETIANFSAHTERAWLSGSYGTARGAQCRLVFGDIPKNRSELAGEFTSPGANDISLYPDQTIRPSIGANPSFGLLAASPHAFLAEETGSFVLDFQIQENIRISGRAALRMGDLGAAKQAWVAVGAFQNLIQDEPGISLEAGATLWGGSVRILTEVKDEPTIGLMFSIPF